MASEKNSDLNCAFFAIYYRRNRKVRMRQLFPAIPEYNKQSQRTEHQPSSITRREKHEISETVLHYFIDIVSRGAAPYPDTAPHPRKRLRAGADAYSALHRNPETHTSQGNR